MTEKDIEFDRRAGSQTLKGLDKLSEGHKTLGEQQQNYDILIQLMQDYGLEKCDDVFELYKDMKAKGHLEDLKPNTVVNISCFTGIKKMFSLM